MSEILVDARGLSCPEPVLMAQDALAQYPGQSFVVAVDSPTARDNVFGLLQRSGRSPSLQQAGGEWRITAAP